MGYTHSWTQSRDFSLTEWGAILSAAQTIIQLADVPLADANSTPNTVPILGLEYIALNGVRGRGLESFVLDRCPAHAEFCKTERLPYDIVVTGILTAVEVIAPDAIHVESDGTVADWRAGATLAAQALPGRIVTVPAGVKV